MLRQNIFLSFMCCLYIKVWDIITKVVKSLDFHVINTIKNYGLWLLDWIFGTIVAHC